MLVPTCFNLVLNEDSKIFERSSFEKRKSFSSFLELSISTRTPNFRSINSTNFGKTMAGEAIQEPRWVHAGKQAAFGLSNGIVKCRGAH